MKTKQWCMGCGAFDDEPCEILGHISQKYVFSEGRLEPSTTTIAATYEGRLQHLKVVIPR